MGALQAEPKTKRFKGTYSYTIPDCRLAWSAGVPPALLLLSGRTRSPVAPHLKLRARAGGTPALPSQIVAPWGRMEYIRNSVSAETGLGLCLSSIRDREKAGRKAQPENNTKQWK